MKQWKNQRLEKLGSQMNDKDHSSNVNSSEFKFQNAYKKKLELEEFVIEDEDGCQFCNQLVALGKD